MATHLTSRFTARSICAIAYMTFFLLGSPSLIADGSHKTSSAKPDNIKLYRNPISRILASKAIIAIHKDSSGLLWIGTQTGLFLYDGEVLSAFSSKQHAHHFAPALDITGITEDSTGTIWISTYSHGIAKYNPRSRRFESAPFTPSTAVTSLLAVHESVLLYSHEGSVKAIDTSTSAEVEWLARHMSLLHTRAMSIIEKSSESTILALIEYGIVEIDFDRRTFNYLALDGRPDNCKRLTKESNDTGHLETCLRINSAFRFLQSSSAPNHKHSPITAAQIHGDFLFVGLDSGLAVFDRDGNHITTIDSDNSILSNSHTTTFFSDEKAIWIGTYKGLNFILISQFETFDKLNNNISNEVLSFAQDQNGEIWVGTYDGLYHVDPEEMLHTELKQLYGDYEVPDPRIMSLASINNELWVGTRRSGLYILDLDHKNNISHDIPDNKILEVTKILPSGSERILVATFNNGAYLLTPNAKSRIGNRAYSAEKITDLRITALFKSQSSNAVFMISEERLLLYDFDSESVREIKLDYGSQKISPIIFSVHELATGDLWIGTQRKGLYSTNGLDINGKSIELNEIFTESVLSESTINAMETDVLGQVWISGSDGIFLVSPDNRFIKRFTVADGLQSNSFNFAASLRDEKGYIYFGGSRGYNRFNPTEINTTTPPPPLILTNINIAGRHLSMPSALNQVESMVLTYEDYFVTFEFSALEFLDPGSTHYRHKLVGFDPEWIDIGNRSSATYTNLPAGDYQLRVQAVNSGGVWNYEGIALDIKMEPPPWFSWWAYSIYSLVILLAAYAAKRVYDTYMLKEQALRYAEEMQAAADRIADDLQDQVEFQAKLADSIHFYQRDVIIWAQRCEELTRQYACDAVDQANQMGKRLHALELLQDALYYQGERLYANLKVFTEHLFDHLSGLQHDQGRRFTLINELADELTPASHAIALAVALTELVDNSLEHAFSASCPACYIRVTLEVENVPEIRSDQLTLTYQDDGVGVPEALSMDTPDSTGFAIIAASAQSVGGDISFLDQERKGILLQFTVPWIRELGTSQAPARD